jgi:NAD(P)-dependent dehydrogenase (short-subunit alcohol dehydrogenase family)
MLWLAAFTTAIKNADELRIAVFSARVGSLTDNGLGGWCSYRASKAALNMSLKCAAIEYARLNKNAKLIAFHPGTTDTAMSKPFQKGVPEGKLFEPSFVAHRLITLLDAIASDGELSYIDWDGKTIPW